MMKSRSSIQKELDLAKFIQRQRITMTSLMALLSGRQKLFVDKMSQMLIRESSDMDMTSEDAELSATMDGNLQEVNSLAKQMI